MKLLFLGGTRFVGRHMVEAALARGHEVTLFHRGNTGPDAFESTVKILGDRTKDLGLLTGTWDAVIDSCGYEPGIVAASAKALEGRVGRYVFISTISVYPMVGNPPHGEEGPLAEIPEGMALTGITPESYGPLKILCEREVEKAYGDRSLIIRPGLVVGPGDYTDRFSYWPVRMRQGDVIVPARDDLEWQWVDARDLGEFTLAQTEKGATGPFNVVGPARKTTMWEALAETRLAANPSAKLVRVDESFLKEHGVEEWGDLPFVLYSGEGPNPMVADISKALAAGFRPRPLADTVRDLLAWKSTLPDPEKLATGLSAERQAELLEVWKSRTAR